MISEVYDPVAGYVLNDEAFEAKHKRDQKGLFSTMGGSSTPETAKEDTPKSQSPEDRARSARSVYSRTKSAALKSRWAKINNKLLQYIDDPKNPEAIALSKDMQGLVKELYRLDAEGDPNDWEGIGLPGPVKDVLIVGAGPGGLAAAVMGGADGMNVSVIEAQETVGGQSKFSSRIENFPGFPIGVSGKELSEKMYEQARRIGAEVRTGLRATGLSYDKKTGMKTVKLSNGEEVQARSVVIAGGLEFRKLEFPGSDSNKVIYGDGEALEKSGKGKDVVVVGGSNGAAQAALGAARGARHVYVLSRSPIEKSMSAYQVTALQNHPKVTVVTGQQIGSYDAKNEELTTDKGTKFPCHCLGLFIGSAAKSEWLPEEVTRDDKGLVKVNSNLETNMPGVFCVGDMKVGGIGRVGAAIGDGQVAERNVWQYFARRKKEMEGGKEPRATVNKGRPMKKQKIDNEVWDDIIDHAFDLDEKYPFGTPTVNDFASWDESKHKRGNPGNKGQFTSGGGSGAPPAPIAKEVAPDVHDHAAVHGEFGAHGEHADSPGHALEEVGHVAHSTHEAHEIGEAGAHMVAATDKGADTHDLAHVEHGNLEHELEAGAIVARNLYGPVIRTVQKLMEKSPKLKAVGQAIGKVYDGCNKIVEKAEQNLVRQWGAGAAGAILGAGNITSGALMGMAGLHGPVAKAIPAPRMVLAIPMLAIGEIGNRLGIISPNSKFNTAMTHTGTWIHALIKGSTGEEREAAKAREAAGGEGKEGQAAPAQPPPPHQAGERAAGMAGGAGTTGIGRAAAAASRGVEKGAAKVGAGVRAVGRGIAAGGLKAAYYAGRGIGKLIGNEETGYYLQFEDGSRLACNAAGIPQGVGNPEDQPVSGYRQAPSAPPKKAPPFGKKPAGPGDQPVQGYQPKGGSDEQAPEASAADGQEAAGPGAVPPGKEDGPPARPGAGDGPPGAAKGKGTPPGMAGVKDADDSGAEGSGDGDTQQGAPLDGFSDEHKTVQLSPLEMEAAAHAFMAEIAKEFGPLLQANLKDLQAGQDIDWTKIPVGQPQGGNDGQQQPGQPPASGAGGKQGAPPQKSPQPPGGQIPDTLTQQPAGPMGQGNPPGPQGQQPGQFGGFTRPQPQITPPGSSKKQAQAQQPPQGQPPSRPMPGGS